MRMLKVREYSLRKMAKQTVNKLLGNVGLRVVGSSWGPRGFLNALYRVKKQGIEPAQIVDIGASNGVWTRDCLRVFPDAEYLLVDPLEENRPFLQELQRKGSKIKTWIGALGAKAGKLPLNVHGDQSSFLRSEYSENEAQGIRYVEVRTLDSFLENGTIRPPGMIKADVQGYEIEALRGAEKCLESAELLLLEVSYRNIYEEGPLAHEAISYAGSKGFRILDICTYALRPFDGELAQSDILFAKANLRLFEYEGWAVK